MELESVVELVNQTLETVKLLRQAWRKFHPKSDELPTPRDWTAYRPHDIIDVVLQETERLKGLVETVPPRGLKSDKPIMALEKEHDLYEDYEDDSDDDPDFDEYEVYSADDCEGCDKCEYDSSDIIELSYWTDEEEVNGAIIPSPPDVPDSVLIRETMDEIKNPVSRKRIALSDSSDEWDNFIHEC